MNEEKRIWLLSIGEYSDYRVVALFDDDHKKEGEEIANLIGGEIEKEPMLLNVYEHETPPPGMQHRSLWMYRDGSIQNIVTQRSSLLDCDGKRYRERYWLETGAGVSNICEQVGKSRWRLLVEMYSKNEEHIVKVANEIRVQILAGARPDKGDLP